MKRITDDLIALFVEEYARDKPTVKEIAEKYGISTGKMYYLLRDAGCAFTRKHRKPITEKERQNRSRAQKGKIISERQRKMISEKNSCNYNGMNGWGHLKKRSDGYLQAYVPKHPAARADGYVMLHTLIVEKELGRYLHDDEVVHHINHIRDDNRLDNLLLMKKHEHMSMHMKERHEKRRNATLTA